MPELVPIPERRWASCLIAFRSYESTPTSSPSPLSTAPSRWGRTPTARQDTPPHEPIDVTALPGRSWRKPRQEVPKIFQIEGIFLRDGARSSRVARPLEQEENRTAAWAQTLVVVPNPEHLKAKTQGRCAGSTVATPEDHANPTCGKKP